MKRYFYIIFLIFLVQTLWSQKIDKRFTIGGMTGITLSQIDGDDLQGYSKKGLLIGLRSNAVINDRLQISIELLFNRRGSKSKDYNDLRAKKRQITTDYAEMNFLFNYKDWYNPFKKLYRMEFYGGVGIGQLFKTATVDELSEDLNFSLLAPEFTTRDVSLIGGANYYVSPNIAIGARFARSFTLLFEAQKSSFSDLRAKNFLGYYISLYGFYMF